MEDTFCNLQIWAGQAELNKLTGNVELTNSFCRGFDNIFFLSLTKMICRLTDYTNGSLCLTQIL